MNKHLHRTLIFAAVLLFQTTSFAQTATVTTVSGTGVGSIDGPSYIGVPVASFNSPLGIALDGSGNLYVADAYNHQIRKITPAGVVSTLAGSGTAGSVDGSGTAASFNTPHGLTVDGSGNVYVIDSYNHKVRKITPAGVVSTIAGSGAIGSVDGLGTAASFNYPRGIGVDASGNLFVGDVNNNKIRKITPAGVVSTFAGSGTAGSLDGTGTAASFRGPMAIAIDGTGNVFVAEQLNHKIRKITAAGVVSTIAGSGSIGSADGTGTAASFYLD